MYRAILVLLLLHVLGGSPPVQAAPAAANVARVDASKPLEPAGPAAYELGANRAPDGRTIGVTDRYLTLNSKPWLPVMGELHYSRLPRAEWEDAILQMKSAGVTIISAYVIWIHHEEIQGTWDWDGQRDLRTFAQLCAKHGMLFFPRLGPWAHAEVRNGGLPDWVMAAGPIRQMDPVFMAETDAFYRQIAAQLQGLLWKDGGPVVGVQIENEYAMRGPGKGREYILALKKMAVAAGLDVPLYTVTGWDNAVVPPRAFLPVYGGYPDAPWDASRTQLPPREVYTFRFGSRVTGDMGMMGAQPAAGSTPAENAATPFLTAESGGGVEDTYHRRPVIAADDVTAMMPVMLGSGVNGYGSYMFHGGENPDGRLSTLQESQATHYPTDVPVKSYDFQAPLSNFGLERLSLRRIKEWNYFLQDFGELLAPMPAYAPAVLPKGPTDLSVLRWSVRTDGKTGFLFVNNYVRGAAMPPRPATQFAVALPGGRTVTVPEQPVDLPAGAYFTWPFELELGEGGSGLRLRYATAQLLMRLTNAHGSTYVFACVEGVRCELAFGAGTKVSGAAKLVQVVERAAMTLITKAGKGGVSTPQVLDVHNAVGAAVRVLLLSADEALEAWRVPCAVGDCLLHTRADVFAGEESVTLRQLGDPAFHMELYPAPEETPAARVPVRVLSSGVFSAEIAPFRVRAEVKQLRPAGQVPPVTLGPPMSWRPVGVAQAPSDAIWATAAAQWSIALQPAVLPDGVSNLFLSVRYAGDQARLLDGKRLLVDDFFNGMPWVVGLKRYAHGDRLPAFELSLLPIRSDAPVYLPPNARKAISATGQTVSMEGVEVLPQYQLQLQTSARVASVHP